MPLNSLTQLNINKRQIKQLKKSVDSLLESFESKSSFFNQMTALWGKLAGWQKIAGGIVFIIPLFIVALATHLITLHALNVGILVMYTLSSLLLDNHHKYHHTDKEHLKQGLFSLANVLETVINSLAELDEQLACEIDNFHHENEQLSKHVTRLNNDLHESTEQTIKLKKIEEKLALTEKELEKTVAEIALNTTQQADLIAHYNAQFNQMTTDSALKQTQLTAHIDDLNRIKIKLTDKLEKAKQIADILQGTVETLSRETLKDAKQYSFFQRRLEDFFNNKELTFDHFAKSIIRIEQELRAVTANLEQSNKQYETLLNRQEIQVERLEKVADNKPLQVRGPVYTTNSKLEFQ